MRKNYRGSSLDSVEYEGVEPRRTIKKDSINMVSQTKRKHSNEMKDPAVRALGARKDTLFVGMPSKQTKKMERYADSSWEEIGTNPKRPKVRAASGKWIQDAIRKPGALHRERGVPMGQKIPRAKIVKATHAKSPLERKRANLALPLEGFRKK